MDAQRVDRFCDEVRYQLLESIPSDASDYEVLQILEHLHEMTGRWIDYIMERNPGPTL